MAKLAARDIITQALILETEQKGLSGNAFHESLQSLLGEETGGLSSSAISVLKKQWEKEFKSWKTRDILEEFVYIWCDGVHFNVRLGGGALGLWSCVREMEFFKETKEQCCWIHKMANILNCLPSRLQARAKSLLNEMMKTPSKSEANRQLGLF